MAAQSSAGIIIKMTKGASTAVATKPTAIVGAKITVTNTAKEGDIVVFGKTGFPALDGKTFVVATGPKATEFDIVLGGLDASAITGTLDAKAEVTVYPASDVITLCVSSIGLNPETAGDINVPTYCDPSATIPGSVASAGSLQLGGYMDVKSEDYKELLQAELDGKVRYLDIDLLDNGNIVAPFKVKSLKWDLPLEGSIAYTVEATMLSKPVHLF